MKGVPVAIFFNKVCQQYNYYLTATTTYEKT